ncbi:MAG: hypothetical protein KG075_14390 [Alphaproteobacteria bacterium]|nr:hypothetical protein [Alphaproteobacteria bacterium]
MLLMLTLGLAETATAGDKRPDPADPQAVVPPHRYVSDFASYRQPQFEQKLDWRQANDTVRDVGGHAGALKGADEPPRTQAEHAGPGMKHGGHGHHGGHKP